MMTDGAAARGAKHTMMRHMSGNTADDSALEAPLRLRRTSQPGRKPKGNSCCNS
jgi:hypothetical protein